LEVFCSRYANLGKIKPNGTRTKRSPCAITPYKRINRQRRDAIRNQTHTSVNNAELQRLVLIHDDAAVRRQSEIIASTEKTLETNRALFARIVRWIN
jgi:hypothetical protein